MVKIRLSKNGSKNNLSYKIVVINSKKSRDGKFIEKVGFLNKNTKLNTNFFIKNERINFWIKRGAKLSKKVNFLLKKNN